MAKVKRKPFTVVSTFAGCGGSSLGYKLAGGKVLLAVEWDDGAVAIYKANHTETDVFHGDIAALSVEEVLERTKLKVGELDILDGSPPCQGFSTAGRRNMEDQRSQLFREFVRLLKGLQPRAFVMENVGGMVTGKMRLIFAEILIELKSCGYRVEARRLNACDYGVPQSRARLIFVGVRADQLADPSHPAPTHAPISAQTALIGLKVDEAEIARLLEVGQKERSHKLWEFLRPGQSLVKLGLKNGFNTLRVNPIRPCPTITKSAGQPGLCGFMHWAERRPFSVSELMRFSSFPDDFNFGDNYRNAVERIGNTVPPLLMKAVASHIRANILEATL